MKQVRFTVVPATADHAMAMLPHVRGKDRGEWVAGTGESTRQRLVAAVLDPSGFARAIFAEGMEVPLILWGAGAAETPGVGQAWLIATNAAERLAFSLHRLLKPELQILDTTFPRCVAYSDKRNVVHHQWLTWAGFDLVEERKMGPFNLPFYVYERTAPCASA
jgi:hypothetical protein